MQPSSSSQRSRNQHLPLSPFRPAANHAAHAIAHAIAKRKPFSIPPLASTTTSPALSRLQDFETLQHENRRLKLGLRQSKEKALLLQTKNQRLEAEMRRRDRHIEVLLTSTKKPAGLVSTPLRQEVHKIRQHQERSTAIKSLQQELVTLRSTVTSLKEKTRSPKAQTLAELTAERDEYLAEVMYLRDVLQEITAAEAERSEAAATISTMSLVVSAVTGPPAAATVADKEESMTPAVVVVPEVPAELTGPATTTSMPNDVTPILSTSSALAEEGGAAATTATNTTVPPTNEEMERGIPQPSSLLSSSSSPSSLPSSSSSSRIPKYHPPSQSLPVRPQHMYRDSLVLFKPPHLEGTKLGSISEDVNDREEGEGEVVKPVLEEEEGQEEQEEVKKEGGAQVLLEEGVITSNEEGLVMVKENEQEEEEQEEEGACLSTCSLYLSQLSPLGQHPDQGAEKEEDGGEEVTLEGSMQQVPALMTTINMTPMEEVEEGKEEEEEEEKRQEKEEGEQEGDAAELVPEL